MNMKVVKSELSYDDIQATQTILTEKFLIETAFFLIVNILFMKQAFIN